MRRSVPTLALLFCGALPLVTGCAAAQYSSRDRRSESSSSSRSDDTFHWTGEVSSGRWVYVRNVNGLVRVERGTSDKVEITGIKHWRRGNPEDVKISVRQVGSGRGDVILCALWSDRDSCDEDGYHGRSWDFWNRNNNNDVSVEFTIRVPSGVRLDASTVNGGVNIDGATSEVVARTVNGNVEARSTNGSVSAKTVNGSMTVRAGAFDHDTEYSTVNGSITVELPTNINAEVDMRTTNGSVSSDFPLTIEGTFSSRRLRARLGSGGPSLKFSTVNGSIRLRKA